jgi:hypothetical protein
MGAGQHLFDVAEHCVEIALVGRIQPKVRVPLGVMAECVRLDERVLFEWYVCDRAMLENRLINLHVIRDGNGGQLRRQIRRHDATVLQHFNRPTAPPRAARIPFGHDKYPQAQNAATYEPLLREFCEKTIGSTVEGDESSTGKAM